MNPGNETLVPAKLEEYARLISGQEDPVLARLSRNTQANVIRARMLSGHLQGRLLELISRMMQPERILEIGTFTGYSAICLARGLKPGGKLHTIDHNPELYDFAAGYFHEAGLHEVIIQHTGEALDVLPGIDGPFDLVFLDADKENYINYFEICFDKLRPGGVILADNVLWSGKVVEGESAIKKTDRDAMGILRFNQHLKTREGICNLLLPVRDGLMITMKLPG